MQGKKKEVVCLFRRTLRKIIPTYASLPLLFCGLGLVGSFGFAKVLQRIFTFEYIDITISWDAWFQFNPGWVVVYAEAFLFWFLTYTLTAKQNPGAAARLATADLVSKFFCLLFFVFLPTTNVRPELEEGGLFNFGMWLVYSLDTPTNLFPSTHCSIAWLGARMLLRETSWKHKPLIALGLFGFCILIFLSTLYTCQHVILDVFGGVVMAEIGLLALRFTKLSDRMERLNERFMTTKLSKIL